jgi:hypothetical protein
MSRPTKETPGGRVYLDLQNRARRERRPTQELMTLYVLERWLARLTASPHDGTFVLKGGVLLAALDARRPTADADLLALHLSNDEEVVRARVAQICRVNLDDDDGVEYLAETITARSIRDHDLYTGIRISINCRLSTAAVKLKLDINFGDPITPEPQLIALPSQRPGTPAVTVLGYPIETVLAEKASTAVALGEANTRVRDYADLYTLTGRHTLTYAAMRAALDATTTHRSVTLVPVSHVIGALPTVRQSAYAAFKRRLGQDGTHLPADFSDVVSAVVAFVDPLATGHAIDKTWMPASRQWRQHEDR